MGALQGFVIDIRVILDLKLTVTTTTLLLLMIPAAAHSSCPSSLCSIHSLSSPWISSSINCIALRLWAGTGVLGTSSGSQSTTSAESCKKTSLGVYDKDAGGTENEGEESEWKCRAERTVVRWVRDRPGGDAGREAYIRFGLMSACSCRASTNSLLTEHQWQDLVVQQPQGLSMCLWSHAQQDVLFQKVASFLIHFSPIQMKTKWSISGSAPVICTYLLASEYGNGRR